jgi:hypothetical protein
MEKLKPTQELLEFLEEIYTEVRLLRSDDQAKIHKLKKTLVQKDFKIEDLEKQVHQLVLLNDSQERFIKNILAEQEGRLRMLESRQ